MDLWIDGTTYLTSDAMIFRPHLLTLHRVLHKHACSVIIPLDSITGVGVRKRSRLSRIVDAIIVDVTSSEKTFSIKCNWSTSFVQTINSQIHQRGSVDPNVNPADVR